MNETTARTLRRPDGRRNARVLVWVLVAVFVAAAGWAVANPLVGADPVVAGTAVSTTWEAAGKTESRLPDTVIKSSSWYKDSDAADLLPLSRWWAPGLEHTQDGTFPDPISGIAAFFAGFLFAIGGMVWRLVAWVMNIAVTLDAVGALGEKINDLSRVLGDGLMGSGLAVLLFGAALLLIAGRVLNHGGRGSVRIMLSVLIPLASVQLMLGAVGDTQKLQDNRSSSAAWNLTPAGLAERGNKAVNLVAAGLIESVAESSLSGGEGIGPCKYYYDTLHRAYALKQDDNTGSKAATMRTLSVLWEVSFLEAITEAQFGVREEGRRAMCQYLEDGRDTTPAERMAIAGAGREGSPYAAFPARDKDFEGYTVFHEIEDGNDRNTLRLAWIACAYENVGAGGGSNMKGRDLWEMKGDQGDSIDGFCADWGGGDWDGEDGGGGWFTRWDDDAMEFKDAGDAASRGYPSGEVPHKVIVSNLGQDGEFNRIALALGAMISAFAYGAALFIPGLGASLATVGLTFFLVLLPATLFLLAVPSKGGNGGLRGTGMKLLKLTGGFIASKAVFLFILALLVQLIMLYSTLFEGIA